MAKEQETVKPGALIATGRTAVFHRPEGLQTATDDANSPLREPLLGSLPYLDAGTDLEQMRPIIEDLVSAEAAKGLRQPKAYLDLLPPEPDMTALLQRVDRFRSDSSSGSIQVGPHVIELPAAPVGREAADPKAWEEALRSTEQCLEYSNAALINSQLLTRYGARVWKLANRDLEVILRRVQTEESRIKDDIVQLNRRRKNEQLRIGKELGKLRRDYRRLVDKNRAIGAALHGSQAVAQSKANQ